MKNLRKVTNDEKILELLIINSKENKQQNPVIIKICICKLKELFVNSFEDF